MTRGILQGSRQGDVAQLTFNLISHETAPQMDDEYSWAGRRYEPSESEEEGVSAVAPEKNRHPRCVEGPYLFAYQYLMWQFSQAWLMPSPTSRSLSLSFASMACSTGTTLSYSSSAIFVKLARSSLMSASI